MDAILEDTPTRKTGGTENHARVRHEVRPMNQGHLRRSHKAAVLVRGSSEWALEGRTSPRAPRTFNHINQYENEAI